MNELSRFDYDLPEQLVAAVPTERRDQSRLMCLDRRTGAVCHREFRDLPQLLREGDLMVMNDARVLPARLSARRETGGAVELLLVRPESHAAQWLAMVRAGGKLGEGESLMLEPSRLRVRMLRKREGGYWTVEFADRNEMHRALQGGQTPVPPYILRARRQRGLPQHMPEVDRERYQTVYAAHDGAVAAPTAGLHFTDELLGRVRAAGVETRALTLLVGPGTFRPVQSERIEEHVLEPEAYHLPAGTAQAVQRALREQRRIVAVGTTTTRVLEYVVRTGHWREHEGWTDLFIHPPFEFRAVGALITNFHLPRSTLLMLVSAFAGRENVLSAYREAVRQEYRFYSYGDAMFIA